MSEHLEHELTPEEAQQLAAVEESRDALAALVDDLASPSRRKRQLAARVLRLLAEREPELLGPYIADMVDALYRPEAQTRWEVLDALTLLVPTCAKEEESAYEGAEDALFDELSATLRLAAFRFMAAWGSTGEERSRRAWPVIDEAIQCFHGDLEYRDMLASLHDFAGGAIDPEVAAELAGRIRFDAENGKGAYLKARSSEIYELLVERFKLEKPQKCARAAKDSSSDDE